MSVLLVRKRAGVVGETQRTCHLVPILDGSMPDDPMPDDPMPDDDDSTPFALTAYCGELIYRGEAELLAEPIGMPCVGCLFRVPMPRNGGLNAHEW